MKKGDTAHSRAWWRAERKKLVFTLALNLLIGGASFGLLIAHTIEAQIIDAGEGHPEFHWTATPTFTPTPTLTPTPTSTPCPVISKSELCNTEWAVAAIMFSPWGGTLMQPLPTRASSCPLSMSKCNCQFNAATGSQCDWVFHADSTTALKLCQLMGFSSVSSYSSKGFSSAGDNTVINYNSGAARFELVPASLSGMNSFITSLKCGTHIACVPVVTYSANGHVCSLQ